MMLTVSCYAVHSVVARFLALWKWAQMMSEWVTFFLSMLCCSCLDGVQAFSNSSDSNSCYKMFSDNSAIVESGAPFKRQLPYSDTEVQIRKHNTQETSQEDLDITDSGDTMGGGTLFFSQACGEPRGQHMMMDFPLEAGDGEIELRNQIYDLGSSSMEMTSGSEPGLVQARGDYMKRALYRARRYTDCRETEVVIKTHYPEYESSTTSQARDTSSALDTAVSHQKIEKLEPRDQTQSSPNLKALNQSIVAIVEVVNQHQPTKDPPVKDNQTIASADHVWEFQNEPEVGIKNHVYSAFRTSSLEDMIFVQKTLEKKFLINWPKSVLEVPDTSENDVNFPAVHKTKKHDNDKVLASIV